ncbi:hypothetical protein XA68_11891 [Ophiocordyceps unilateralis]|uniref:glycerol kinase n=1 Tax=Ophiocordyceps unilateralis TaxID=268505 RepID=A0A2A9PFW3_OPHUN|nr:hypothetical protein XA68_11891 [Ophiocordyceps unilateralis]
MGDYTRPDGEDVFVGSIDQGTTSSRFIIFDQAGEAVAGHQVGICSKHPQPGWHEHDPLELLRSVETCIEQAVDDFRAKGHHAAQIRAVGLANQRETLVTWDAATGEPLCNAVVWSDTRTAPLVRELKARAGADVLVDRCGQPPSTSASAIKLLWLLCNSEAVARAYDAGRLAVGTVDTWLIYRLNGGLHRPGGPVYVTDPTNASRTMWMDIRTRQYDDELLSFFGVDRSKLTLPAIFASSHPTAFGALAHGPLAGVRIAGCLGDQSAALVGHGGFSPGKAKSTYGTGCFLLYNVGPEPVISKNGLQATVAYDLGDGYSPAYALEGSVSVAGSGVTFLLNNLGFLDSCKAIDEVALSVPDNGGVYFVTAFSGLLAPYWIDDAQGTLFGITAHTQKGHIARATLEAVCHQTAAILDAMAADSGHGLETLAVDGGLSSSDLCMQTQADLSGIPVDRPAMREATSLGAALAAGLATGVWEGLDQLAHVGVSDRSLFRPGIAKEVRCARRKMWERAVQMSRGWLREFA